MAHDVYIYYDEKDREVCDAVLNAFEKNNITTWVKSRDLTADGSVDMITNAITDSKCFVLIFSKNSKDTNYIVTETAIAFSRELPIIVFNIDDSKVGKNLEFILDTQKTVYSFPNSKRQLEELVRETSGAIGKPADGIKVNSKSVETLEAINPKRKENAFKKYVKIAVPIAVALLLIYFVVIVPTGQHTTDGGVFSMNVTDVDVDGLKYTVHGESYNMPSDSINYFMNVQFFDENDDLVYEVNSTADEFKSGIIWSGNLHDDNVTHIGFRLTDINGNVLSKDNYVVE